MTEELNIIEEEKKPILSKQDLSKINIDELTPLTYEVISRQATINIGTIGHVAHGKSTVVKAISGVKTVRFKTEMVRNITIKLGYANAKIYKCNNESCKRPGCYSSFGSSTSDKVPCVQNCGGEMELLRHVSFVDCFGEDTVFIGVNGEPISIRQVEKGTVLLGPDGKNRVVQSTKEGTKELYRVSFETKENSDGEMNYFDCTGGHLLCLRIDTPVESVVHDLANDIYFVRHIIGDNNGIVSKKVCFNKKKDAEDYYQKADKGPVEFEITVEAYLLSAKTFCSKARLYYAKEMNFPYDTIDLSLGEASEEEIAYLIGVWLGDGNADSPKFTFHSENDAPIVEKICSISKKIGLIPIVKFYSDRKAGWVILSTQSGISKKDTEYSNEKSKNCFYQLLLKLNLIQNKHIPDCLKFHNMEVRRSLVAGIIDTDGTYSKGQFDLEQSKRIHDRLFNDFVFVLRSLGFITHLSSHTANLKDITYIKNRVRFNGFDVSKCPIQREDKKGKDLVRRWTTSQQFTIEPIGKKYFRGFNVDGDGKVLLHNFMVVHNCPGHDILMATMLNGAAVMDAALLLVAGNAPCPQPQTSEHLAAVEIMKLKHIIILQNKIDLVQENEASQQYKEIKRFIKGTVADSAPIVPISAQLKFNIDVVCEYMVKHVPIPIRDFKSPPKMIVIRSFDVNKPGEQIDDLKGGVAGGTILQGVLKVGQSIEVRPGIVARQNDGTFKCYPIFSKIISLFAEENELQYAVPGGLIGVGTKIDPTLTRADRLVGQVLGEVDKLPDVFAELEVSFFLLRTLLGVKSDGEKKGKIEKLKQGEVLMVNIGSTSTGGRIIAVEADLAKIALTNPVCTSKGEKLALSRRVEKHWRLIGWGTIRSGVIVSPSSKQQEEEEEENAELDKDIVDE